MTVELHDFADAGSDLLQFASFSVVIVIVVGRGFGLKLGARPGQILVEELHERLLVVFKELWDVLAVEIEEELEAQQEGLGQSLGVGRGREGLGLGQELIYALENGEVGLTEAVEDVFNLGEEGIGAELGAPAFEDRVSCAEYCVVDDKVVLVHAREQLLLCVCVIMGSALRESESCLGGNIARR